MAYGRLGALPGHAQKKTNSYAAMFSMDLLLFSAMSVQKERTLACCLGPGRQSHEASPEYGPPRFTLLLSSSDMAHHLLHSHLSAGKEYFLY